MPDQQTTTKAFGQDNTDLNKENRDFSPEPNPSQDLGESSARTTNQDFKNVQSSDASQAADNGSYNQPEQKPTSQSTTDAEEAQSDGDISFPPGK